MLRKKKTTTVIEGLEHRILFATFTVTSTADAGPGSLRQAIVDSNAAPSADTVVFAIGTGPQTISPATPLPAITDIAGLTIDASTQPGFAAGTPVITLDGSSAGPGAEGLIITGGNSLIRGLIIQDFAGDGVALTSGSNHNILGNVIIDNGGAGILSDSDANRIGGTAIENRNVIGGNGGAGITVLGQGTIIEGNRIGTNAAGTVANGNGGAGVSVANSPNVIVISNVVSGNTGTGLSALNSDDLLAQGNFIGTNATGTAALANSNGVLLDSSDDPTLLDNVISGNTNVGLTLASSGAEIRGNMIGVNAAGGAGLGNGGAGITIGGANSPDIIDNVISANAGAGINVADAVNNATIQSNFIGTAVNGTTDLGNGGDGIKLSDSGPAFMNDALVGGTSTGLGNVIAFNDGAGVFHPFTGSNSILGNSIFSNGGLGIDLGVAGRTPNDTNDVDSGPNGRQNFPVILSAVSTTGTTTTFGGTFNSNASEAFRLEFFSDTAGGASAEGRAFLGFINVTTDSSGNATFNSTLTASVLNGSSVTATATDADGNTSEFSDAIEIGATGPDIDISGNSTPIPTGSDTPNTGDGTDFGSSVIGTPIDRTFTVANTGTAPLDLSSGVTLSGPGAAQFTVFDQPNTTLAAATTTTFVLRFTPTSAGTQSATITLESDDPDETPYTFDVRGTGTTATPLPEIELSGNGNPIASGDTTPSLNDHTNFGEVIVGGASITRTFTLSNAGQQDLTVGAVSLSDSGAQQFAVTAQPGLGTVAPGQSTTFAITFSPTSGGLFLATVSLVNSDSNENPYLFAIRGLGSGGGDTAAPTATLLPPLQQPVAQLNSATFDFIIRYSDDEALSVGSFDNNDVVLTGPNGFIANAMFVAEASGGVTQADVTYRVDAPGGTLDAADDGAYTVTIQANQVSDSGGNTVAAGSIGTLDLDLASSRTSLGTFGVVNGRRQRLTIAEDDGTAVTLTLTNGTGEVFKESGRLDLDVRSNNGKLIVRTSGGNGRAEISDIRVTGSLNALVAKTSDVNGVIIGATSLIVGSTTGSTISTPLAMRSLVIQGNMTDTDVLSGALLGTDGRVGGTGAAADLGFGAGSIRKFNVSGTITDSLIAAGLDPVDSILTNGNGIIVGGVTSKISNINAKGAVDANTIFAAGAYPKRARLGGLRIDPLTDNRFDMTP